MLLSRFTQGARNQHLLTGCSPAVHIAGLAPSVGTIARQRDPVGQARGCEGSTIGHLLPVIPVAPSHYFPSIFFAAFDARPQLMKTKNNAAPTAISAPAVNKGVDRFGFDAVEMMLRRR